MGAGHDHGSDNPRRLLAATALAALFVVIEAGGGWMAHSLALVADAGHMLADTASLGLAWFAAVAARRPSDDRRTYGYHRFQVLAAFVNGALLIAITAWIVYEAIGRLFSPLQVHSILMLAVGVLAVLLNLGLLALLHGGDRHNLNVRGAILHVIGDLLGAGGAVAAALVIRFTGWVPADPLLSILVAALILRSAWHLVRESVHILLEGTPADLDPDEIRRALASGIPAVQDIHHLHAWSLTENQPMVTLHARIAAETDTSGVLDRIHALLAERFGIRHATVQIEHGSCPDEPDRSNAG
ncbi:MAG TPA: cation diffusion facilitator family transporter [Gammaproteobacteria bacterium]|nr:cation diffusion facilitator family transporter [Gammaproteobacteria bacterium]